VADEKHVILEDAEEAEEDDIAQLMPKRRAEQPLSQTQHIDL